MNQAQQLRDGIQALGLDIDEAKQAKLLDYAALRTRREVVGSLPLPLRERVAERSEVV